MDLRLSYAFGLYLLCCCLGTTVVAQQRGASFTGIILPITEAPENGNGITAPWWQTQVSDSINPTATRFEAGVNDLLQLAIENSAKISVAGHVPKIRQTAITEAAAAFDWSRYVDTMWADTSEPVGSSLTVGGNGTRFNDHNWSFTGGLRKRLRGGSSLDVSQQLGFQNNNSNFFIPQDQATSRVVLGFTQPLLRGSGRYYNESLILLAQIDVQSANDEFRRQLQAHLLEVVNGYWSLYLERASLAQKFNLFQQTEKIASQLKSRQKIDAGRTQLVSAQAALQKRKSDLVRAVAAVKNAETRLRALINAEGTPADPDSGEIIPLDHPMSHPVPTDVQTEFTVAMSNRPEIMASMKAIRAAAVRLDMSDHEILPKLDLVTQVYVAGLRGETDFDRAWRDQFQRGAPSYSVGLQYEVPFGRRAACARKSRRELELSQMQEEYREAVQLIRAEVEVSVREVKTAHKELMAKNRARFAAQQEVEILEARWRENIDVASGGQSLESLLRAQERLTAAEYEVARAQLTYNLALVSLRHANGTLLSIMSNDFQTQAPPLEPTIAPQSDTPAIGAPQSILRDSTPPESNQPILAPPTAARPNRDRQQGPALRHPKAKGKPTVTAQLIGQPPKSF